MIWESTFFLPKEKRRKAIVQFLDGDINIILFHTSRGTIMLLSGSSAYSTVFDFEIDGNLQGEAFLSS